MTEHWAISVIRDYEDREYYGSLTLQFKSGVLVLIREERTILPPQQSEEPTRSMK